MGKTLAEIDAMPASEFNQWQAYHRLFPFGDERDDWRMGSIVATLVNAHSKRGGAKASDFMLKPPQTQKQKEAGLKAALRGAGTSKARSRQRQVRR